MSEDLERELLAAIRELRDAVRSLPKPAAAEPRTMRVADAARELDCGPTRVYQLIRAGQLTAAPKLGKHRMVTTASVRALQQAAEGANEAPSAPAAPQPEPAYGKRFGRLLKKPGGS